MVSLLLKHPLSTTKTPSIPSFIVIYTSLLYQCPLGTNLPTNISNPGQTVHEALKGALKLALIHDGLARGLREASKALDRRQAHMCVLNEACEEEAYKKLVKALCGEHSIPLIQVGDGKLLGEWAGLCECFFSFPSPFRFVSICFPEFR